MWQSLKNVFYSLRTYADLSPDLRMRRRVNRSLRHRPALTPSEWYETFWQAHGVSRRVSDFVYIHLQECSGLELGRVYPSDRLNEDLFFPLICWFDWEIDFCAKFLSYFGIDLDPCFEISPLTTMEDFILFLNKELLSMNHS